MESSNHGNVQAAADLYGNGVRIGIYLQGFGMTLAALHLRTEGVMISSAASMIAILVSWMVLIQREEISPAEAYIILYLVAILFYPCLSILGDLQVGFTAILAAVVANILFCIAIIRFWGGLFKSLPLLDTTDSAWCFTRVNIKGWFHWFNLFYGLIVFPANGLAVALLRLTPVITQRFRRAQSFHIAMNIASIFEPERDTLRRRLTQALIGLGALYIPFGIATVEMGIRYNHLIPAADFISPGQSIPLVIGIFVLLDGTSTVLKHVLSLTNMPTSRQRPNSN